jgi:2-oxo-3-hexenedioate decarboxylase/2-keto-4-pentenoate hydratase
LTDGIRKVKIGMTSGIVDTAELIAAEHREGKDFHAFDGLPDLATAYRVQKAYVGRVLGDDRIAGYKIGLTSQRMQTKCGIDHPISGAIFAKRVLNSGAKLRATDYRHLGLEFEICARLGRDLSPRKAPYSREEIGAAVDAVCAAVELVDDRHADYAVLDCKSLVADNSWNAGVVLGRFVAPPPALEKVEGVVYQNGTEIGRGSGADALGHPFEPLAWLANHLAAQGEGLKKGDVVMTGSIVTTRFPEGAFNYRFDVTGLGSVEVSGT